MDTLYGFDMIPESLYNEVQANGCKYGEFDDESETCWELYEKSENLTVTLNPYDLYKHNYKWDDLKKGVKNGQARFKTNNVHAKKLRNLEETCVADDQVHLTAYLNRSDVREALHIPEDIQPWQQCTDDPRWDYTEMPEASEWIYRVLKAQQHAGNNIRMIHYSGDVDGVVPTYGTKQWIKNLNWDVLEPDQPWKLKDEVNGDQVQGFVTSYDGLDFATIKGVGHMAP